jgi:hypothetical protein
VRGKPVNFMQFARGLAGEPEYLLNPEYLRAARNVVPLDTGGVQTRDGFAALSGALGITAPTGLIPIEAGGIKYLVANNAADIRRIKASDGTITTITDPGGVLNTRPVSAITSGGQGPIYCPGLAAWTKWQYGGGAAASAWTASAGTLPTGLFALWHAFRMWVTGDWGGTNASRVSASSLGDPRNWSATAPNDAFSVDLDPEDGQLVTGIAPVGPYVLVFKERKTFIIYDTNNGASRQISNTIGVPAGYDKSIQPSPYGVFFLSHDGVYVTDGQGVTKVSGVYDGFLKGDVNYQTQDAAGVFFGDHYYLQVTLTNSDANMTLLDYDAKTKTWWRQGFQEQSDVARAIRSFTVAPNPTTLRPELYAVCDDVSGGDKLFRAFVSGQQTDSSLAFDWFMQPGWHVFGEPSVNKRITELRLDSANLDSAVEAIPFVEMAFVPSQEIVLSPLTNVQWEAQVAELPTQARFYTPGWGRAIGLRMYQRNSRCRIDGYMMGVALRAD